MPSRFTTVAHMSFFRPPLLAPATTAFSAARSVAWLGKPAHALAVAPELPSSANACAEPRAAVNANATVVALRIVIETPSVVGISVRGIRDLSDELPAALGHPREGVPGRAIDEHGEWIIPCKRVSRSCWSRSDGNVRLL